MRMRESCAGLKRSSLVDVVTLVEVGGRPAVHSGLDRKTAVSAAAGVAS